MIPTNWEAPEWHNATRVHDWRNYASAQVKAIWLELPAYARRAFAANLQDIADKEEWE